jgi:signal transduction histidine kinase
VWSGDATLLASDGREVPVSLVALAHFRGDDSVERYSAVARDLSREKELEEQLFQSQKMEALGRMAGGAAHDFNNLLSVIMGSTDLALASVPEESPLRELLEGVLDASKRATELTQQMLTFSRKSVSRQRVVVDVNDVVERMKHIVLRLLGKDIDLRMRLAPDLGNICADPTQVEQVILNLVVNARDAMPKGGTLTVQTQPAFINEASARAAIKLGAHVVLRVSDTGSGMDTVTKARIFEPFFTTKRPGEGTGLGLATVFGIVKQSGGSIRVDSELGRGTSFDISFPCTKAPATASHAEAP